jgi:LysR family transcriptional regulator, glycine cleavage system transcriptional activator
MKNLNAVAINGLRALEAVGRLGSLKAAADELGVSVGAVSQQVIKAEAQIGTPLFRRTTKGLVPSETGLVLLPRLTAGFRELSEAVAFATRRPASLLTISVAPVLASKWLVPRLGRYAALNPDIQLRLDATTELVDLNGSDVDIALRVGPGGWKDVTSDFLVAQEIFPVCAPALAGRLRRHADILDVPVALDAHSVLEWETWLAKVGLSGRTMRAGHSFTDAALAIDAAIAGQGVMLAWPTLAAYAISAGQLVMPFPERAATGLGYYAVTARGRREERRVSAFKSWLKGEIEETMRLFAAPPA